MISHKLKCIFIHIPGTAGTSIEKALVGQDWWMIDSSTKHMLASQAKQLYRDYWDDYFKFSFVRNPWARTLSMRRFPDFFNFNIANDEKWVEGYVHQFEYPFTIEYDHRFYTREQVESTGSFEKYQVYGNILNEPLDFIGKYENLKLDFIKICRILGVEGLKLPKASNGRRRKPNDHYSQYYNDINKRLVMKMYLNDIKKYGYSFEQR